MAHWKSWIQASRPLAQGNLAPALVFGQALAWMATGSFSWTAALFVHTFGILDHLFIVFANDYADHEADKHNQTFNLFSGGSRVVPEGKITPRELRFVALYLAGLLLSFGVAVSVLMAKPIVAILALVALLLLFGYSYPPLRLSYRGNGELLQGLGVGVVLPCVGYSIQAPSMAQFPWAMMVPSFLLAFAGNITTALPDFPSDRASSKRSWPVRNGELHARVASLVILGIAGYLMTVVTPQLTWKHLLLLLFLPACALGYNGFRILDADAKNHRSCLTFVVLNGVAATWLLVAWAMMIRAMGP
jgi:1,4-dihydroxy-2-naphthoate polyprenyltransferase